MLPQAYGVPAAVVLIVGGALACFAGYRLFRIVLGIYGFILGAAIASSTLGVSNTAGMVAAAVVGGLVGAVVLVFAYFVGIALVGAGLGVLVAHAVWGQVATGDPTALVVIVSGIAGAIGAMLLQRYVIIVGTAFAGAWTIVLGTANALATRGLVRGASASDVWIFYPTTIPEGRWAPAAWLLLGVIGAAVQLGITAKKR